MGFSRAELQTFQGATVPDLLPPDARLLFVGINPGLLTAAVQAHFARRGNRFYPALFAAGIVDRLIDASEGYKPDDLAHLIERGIGITNLVSTASARADELTHGELVEGSRQLTARIERVRPGVVAMLGITSYRVAFGRPRAAVGLQPERIGGGDLRGGCESQGGAGSWEGAGSRSGAEARGGAGSWEGAELWVVPNPSGLNAHSTLASLAAAHREVAVAAGLTLYDV